MGESRPPRLRLAWPQLITEARVPVQKSAQPAVGLWQHNRLFLPMLGSGGGQPSWLLLQVDACVQQQPGMFVLLEGHGAFPPHGMSVMYGAGMRWLAL